MKKLILLLTVSCSLTLASLGQAADQPCGAEAAVTAFQAAANGALSLLPALDKDVDSCFNPDHPSYITQTHKTLQSVSAQYQSALTSLAAGYDNLQRGQDADFISAVATMVPAVAAVNKPLFDNAGNLKNYGFTVSDSMRNGQYKYPSCNSKNNDQPTQIFTTVYNDAVALQKAGVALQSVATCLKK